MTTEMYIMISIAIYLGGMIFIGIKSAIATKDVKDFYLGGRKLGPVVTAMSAEASDMSSWLLMGLPGVAYLTGLADATWTAIGLAIGTYVNWLFIAKRIRVYSQVADNSITIPDFFSRRFGDDKNILMLVSALMIIIFFIPYTASGFAACGKLFSSIFGLDYHVTMVVSALVIILYTTLGGFLAASTTDLIQSIVMTIALFVVINFGLNSVDGLGAVMDSVKDLDGYLSLTSSYDSETGTAVSYGLVTVLSGLAWGLGYVGMPHILLRFMAIEDENKLHISRRIATVWVIISMMLAIFIGVVGYAMTANGVLDQLLSSQAETIIIVIAGELSKSSSFMALVGGLILAGILAATMSTSDSQLLTASSATTENIFKGYFGKNLNDKESMLYARLCVLFIALIGIVIAWDSESSVFGIVSFAWAGFGATFGPVMICALFWKRATKEGAIWGMLTGGIVVFVWKYFIKSLGGMFGVYELLPAFILAITVIYVVSLKSEEPSSEITDKFDEVVRICNKK